MVEGMLQALAVVGIFAVVATLLTLYVWRCDPHQFTTWRKALRRRADAEEASPDREKLRLRLPRLRIEVAGAAPAPEPAVPATTPVRKSASARLEYWIDMDDSA